ncbi:MAG: tRNA lysidine(34) synthetase TilS [Comamonadaceae bacterium]|nr:tRNA lysidine(34) synthetase TilS [Comamonadaceae bacterium]
MTQSVAQAIAAFSPSLPLTVAYSGGADSTALLLACVQKWPGQIRAVHVHHGLQPAADDFVKHCQDCCDGLKVPLTVLKVDARHRPGDSPEDAARRARYKAFEALAHISKARATIYSIALAQHADDQAETLLLALSRGSGLPGLSAMPGHWTRAGIAYHRPLLRVSAADIRQWLAGQGTAFIEDPSNVDEAFTRNRIRARLLPAFESCFPHFRDTLARSAAHAAQAQSLLSELAGQDLAQLGVPPNIRALQGLSRPRLANVLRHWLQSAHQVAPSAAQLDELMRQLAACKTRGHQLHLKVANGFCERRGALLHWYNPAVLMPTQSQ